MHSSGNLPEFAILFCVQTEMNQPVNYLVFKILHMQKHNGTFIFPDQTLYSISIDCVHKYWIIYHKMNAKVPHIYVF